MGVLYSINEGFGEARGFYFSGIVKLQEKLLKWESSKVIVWETGIVLKSPSWDACDWRIPEGASKCVFGMKGWEEVCVGRGWGCLVKSLGRNLPLAPGLGFTCRHSESQGRLARWRTSGAGFPADAEARPSPCPGESRPTPVEARVHTAFVEV